MDARAETMQLVCVYPIQEEVNYVMICVKIRYSDTSISYINFVF